MRKTPIFLKRIILIITFLSISIGTIAQNVTLKIDKQRLSNVLSEITQRTGYKFIYSSAIQNKLNVIVSIDCTNETITIVLDKLFKDKGISYKIDKKNIALAPIEITHNSKQNENKNRISGRITDENEEPLVGVVILNENTQEITLSDINGNYAIKANNGDRLAYSLLGMETYYAIADKNAIINVPMKIDMIALSDVVVTGYQTISKERATGSYDNVGAKYLKKPQTSIEQSLIGNIAGLQFSDSGEQLIIRGTTSLDSNSSPLVVLDGFAIEGPLSSINPNDIASITVLKDAAAASIWGARSANGVIVVSTKKAEKGKINVELNSFVRFSGYFNLDYANPLASSAETVEYEKLGFKTNFFNRGSYIEDNYSYDLLNDRGRIYSQVSTLLNENRLGYISDTELSDKLAELSNYDNKKQIKKHLMARPLTQQYNLNISGGTDKINNFLSLMYENSSEHLKRNKNSKYTINYRNNVALYKWLDLSFSSMFQYTDIDNNGTSMSAIQSMSPYDMLIDKDGNYCHVPNNLYMPLIQRYIIDKGIEFPYSNWIYNPIQDMNSQNVNTKSIYGRFQLGLNFKIIDGLSIDSKVQYEILDDKIKSIYGEDNYSMVRFPINYSSSWDGDPSTPVTQNNAKGMALGEDIGRVNSYNIRNQINFNRTFNNKHTISAIIGTEVSERVGTSLSNFLYGYNDELLTITPPPQGVSGGYTNDMFGYEDYNYYPTYPSGRRSYSNDRYFSSYANTSYTFDNKYTISGSVRTDASNLISSDPSIRYSPFWSVGALWNISKEKFIKSINWIDELSLRATYGFNGNVDKSTSVEPLISIWAPHPYTGTQFGIISNYGNPYLGWEKTGAFDFGIDFSLFNGKLFGKLDVYDKEGRDLISTVSTASVYGSDSQSMNAISMYNRGFELTLGTSLSKENFIFSGNINFAYNKNKITKLYKDPGTLAYRVYGSGWDFTEGYDASTIWVFKYGGMQNISGTNQPVIVDKNGENPRNMNTEFTSFDSRNYLISAGKAVAPYTIGFNGNMGYKNLSFSFTITGQFGHKFLRKGFNYPTMSTGSGDINKYYSEALNCDPNKLIPIPDFIKGETYPTDLNDYADMMDYLACNAGNIRIQEINLSYKLGKKYTKKLRINGLSFYGQLTNIGTILFNKYGQDPRYPMGSIKPPMSYTFGFEFKF